MHFKVIKDYRQAAKVEHEFSDIILLTICRVLAGFDTWEGICDFENGIPSSDTIARVIGMESPSAMQKAFISWMKDCHQITQMAKWLQSMVKPFAAFTTNLKNVLQFIWSTHLQPRKGFVLDNRKLMIKRMRSQKYRSFWNCKIFLVA